MSSKLFDKRMAEIGELFHDLCTDTNKNIDILVEKTYNLLKGVCSVYNRFDDKRNVLYVRSGFNIPRDLKKENRPDGHICYEETIKGKDAPIIIEDLQRTKYRQTDPNVKKYDLRSYLGYPITISGNTIGSLCIVDKKKRTFNDTDVHIMYTLAKAVTLEEERNLRDVAYQNNQKRLSSMIESTSDWLWEIDQNGVYTYVSPMVKDVLGYEQKEMIGKKPFDLMPPEEAARMGTQFKKIISNKCPIERVENMNLTKNGESVILETSGVPILSVDGTLLGYRGIDRDITSQKRIQLDSIIQTIPDIIYRLDANGSITFISDSIKRYGYQPNELLGKNILEIIYIDDKEKATKRINERRAGIRGLKSFEVRFITKNKETFSSEIFIISAEGLYRAEGEDSRTFIGTQGIARDITCYKQLEKESKRSSSTSLKEPNNIKMLKGLLAICSNCKKIRDDNGFWIQLEEFIEKNSEALFSHGLCQECMDYLYKGQDWYQKNYGDD